tara:strand:+ start:149 stop:490 length:342 start_codon:yes stop_codon:yes gene_type:complete
MSKIKLTKKEFNLLIEIRDCQNEMGNSEFLSCDVKTKSRAGILSSLIKKEMVNTIDMRDWGTEDDFMFQMNIEAVEFVGVPGRGKNHGWEYSGDWKHHVKHGGKDYEAIYLTK